MESDFLSIKKLIHEVGINPTGLGWRRFVVAVTPGGEVLACGQLKPHNDGTIEMASIAVQSSARKQGIARILIERLISEAPRPLYLTCRREMSGFYQKFGFQPANNKELPDYFRRLSRFVGLLKAVHLLSDNLLVMVLN